MDQPTFESIMQEKPEWDDFIDFIEEKRLKVVLHYLDAEPSTCTACVSMERNPDTCNWVLSSSPEELMDHLMIFKNAMEFVDEVILAEEESYAEELGADMC